VREKIGLREPAAVDLVVAIAKAIERTREVGASGGDSARLTCLLCKQAISVRMHPPHAKGPEETKIACLHDRKLVFWTKSSWPRHVSKKNKKRHCLRLTMHADVASFNIAVKPIYHTDRMQKIVA
jgi:hypothetical protein